MAYTSTDLQAIQAARVTLNTGKQVARVTIAGKSIEYTTADAEKLRQLESDILRDLNAAAGKKPFYLTRSSKGL